MISTNKILGLKPAEEQLIREIKSLNVKKSRKGFFMMVLALFCFKTGQSVDYFSESEQSFMQRIEQQLRVLPASPELKEFFALILTQRSFEQIPTFKQFVEKIIKCVNFCENDFEQKILNCFKKLSARKANCIDLRMNSVAQAPFPVYEVSKQAEQAEDENPQCSFGPTNTFKIQSTLLTSQQKEHMAGFDSDPAEESNIISFAHKNKYIISSDKQQPGEAKNVFDENSDVF